MQNISYIIRQNIFQNNVTNEGEWAVYVSHFSGDTSFFLFNNQIINNKTFGVSVASYYVSEKPFDDEGYNPYPTRIHIHDNVFERKKQNAYAEK